MIPDNAGDVGRLLRPRSVAVIGVSDNPGSMGGRALQNLENFGIEEIHLVSRNNAMVRGRPCVPSIDDLPEGIDAVIIALPRSGVVEAVEACARRKVGGVVIFAAGFAEADDEGRQMQAQLTAIARSANMAVLGPNTLGMTNYIDGITLAFGPARKVKPEGKRAVAILAQSGAMMGSTWMSALARNYGVAYAVATGNEAVSGIEDFMAHFVDDPHTSAIAVFAEQLRQPQKFLALARRARVAGKPVILMHPGKSQAARDSAASHTGALSGDHEVMRAMVASEAVIVVETLEEFLDASEFLTRFPNPLAAGPAVMSDSGAMRGLALDYADSHGFTLPQLADQTSARLREVLPAFAEVSNPLDITAQGLKEMQLYGDAAGALLADPECGGLLIAVMPGSPEVGVIKADAILPALDNVQKPCAYVVLGDAPVDPGLPQRLTSTNVPFLRSSERALRAFATLQRYARLKHDAAVPRLKAPAVAALNWMPGTQAEHVGKALLRSLGVRTPRGGLAADADAAVQIATQIGWPVVLKIQSAALPHKTEIGGVKLGIASEAGLRAAWADMVARAQALRPDAVIDGCLVEEMIAPGLELVVGGRRDPQWGPVVLFGLGGVWIEVLRDVRLIPADLSDQLIRQELGKLQAHALIEGHRGQPGIAIDELIKLISTVGTLLRTHPDIAEFDINPLIAYPDQPPIALDALIVTGAA